MPAEFGGVGGWLAMATLTHTQKEKSPAKHWTWEVSTVVSPEVFLSDIFDVARQNMCCDIFAVNSLSVLERKAKSNINCSVFHMTAVFYINCRLFRLFHIKWTSKNLQTTCTPKRLCFTSTAVCLVCVWHQVQCSTWLPCSTSTAVCCVCLFKFGWNKAHAKKQIKLFHAGLKITCKNVQTFPNLQLQI